MTDKEYINNLTIWCTYHDDKLIKEYNLDYIPSYIKLFNTSDLNLKNDNINHLGKNLNEICAYYYVWKNQIKSDYVGFCHYRRFFNSLGKTNIEEYGIQCYIMDKYCLSALSLDDKQKYHLDELYNYLCTRTEIDKHKLYKYFYNPNEYIYIPFIESFIFSWYLFNKTCDIYFGFLDFLLPNFKDIKHYGFKDRSYGWMSEFVLGIIVLLLTENLNHDNQFYKTQTIILTESNDLNKILTWIKKNNRTNAQLYVLSNIDNLYELICEAHHYNFCNVINNINQLNTCDNEIIKLNINEYIKCLDPIEFRNKNYTIEKII